MITTFSAYGGGDRTKSYGLSYCLLYAKDVYFNINLYCFFSVVLLQNKLMLLCYKLVSVY